MGASRPELPERLSKSEKIVYCSGMDSPPLVSFDTQQKPVGLQVDMGEAIAQRLGASKSSGASRLLPG